MVKILLTLEKTANIFKLMGDKNRLTILCLLREKELCVCEIVDFLQTSQSNISQHMRKLKDGGLVKESKRGQWVHYSLTEEFEYFNELIDTLPADIKKDLDQLKPKCTC